MPGVVGDAWCGWRCLVWLVLPGVVGAERGGLSVEGVTRGQVCAVNLTGNR